MTGHTIQSWHVSWPSAGNKANKADPDKGRKSDSQICEVSHNPWDCKGTERYRLLLASSVPTFDKTNECGGMGTPC